MRRLLPWVILMAVSAPALGEELTKDELVRLHEAGFRNTVLITKIRASGITFEVDTETMLELKEKGIHQDVIEALLEAEGGIETKAPSTRDGGRLELQSQPPGARITEGGQFLGQTPFRGELPPGRHVLQLELEGYESKKLMVALAAGQSTEMSVPLRPSEGAVRNSGGQVEEEPAIVYVIKPGGGVGTKTSVYVDDLQVARLPRNRYFIIRLKPGKSTLNAEGRGNDPKLYIFESGVTYYFKVHQKFLANGRDVSPISQSQAEKYLKKYDPIPLEWVFDRDRIVIAQ